MPITSSNHRSGFVSFVGRPNVGKSTLLNALVGEKLAITSDRPQTTRKIIRGIVQRDVGELIIVDTPGLHRPKTLLGNRLNDLVDETLTDVDVIAMCFPSDEKIGPGDEFILNQIRQYSGVKLVALVTKTDKASRAGVAEKLMEVSELHDWEAIIPVSSSTGEGLEIFVDELISQMPFSPQLYPDNMKTESTTEERIAEIIRESALELVTEELPHSIAVTIDEILDKKIFASVWVERDSQKGIVIGKGGSKLKQIGSVARQDITELLGHNVHLHLQVKLAQDWQKDPKLLNKLGF